MTPASNRAKKQPVLPKGRVGIATTTGQGGAATKHIMKPKTAKTKPAKRSVAVVSPRPFRIKSILVPLDFSDPSRKALGEAVALAKQFKARLTLLHVVEPVATPDCAVPFPLVTEDPRLRRATKDAWQRMIEAARVPHGLVEKTLVRYGRSFHEIVAVARRHKVDLILIATHGYTGLKHALLGSTTERVVRLAPCAVLVVRQC